MEGVFRAYSPLEKNDRGLSLLCIGREADYRNGPYSVLEEKSLG